MRVWLEGREVTGLCIRTAVEKHLDGAGAEAEIAMVCAPTDSRLPRLDPACGQRVEVRQQGETLFFGRVERVSYDAAALELTVLAFDPVSLLAKNHCRGPYLGTPQSITRQLCRECGLEPGDIWPGDGQEVRLGAACGRSAFRTICSLYDGRCVLDWRDRKVDLYPRGVSRAVLASGQLTQQRLPVHTDAHGRQLQRAIQHRIPHQEITIQPDLPVLSHCGPIVIVRSTPIVLFPIA